MNPIEKIKGITSLLLYLAFLIFKYLLGLLIMGPILVILAVFLFPGITQKFNRELTEKSVTRLLDDHHFNQLLWLLHTKRKTIEKMPPARRVFYHYLEAEAYSGIGEFRLAEQCYTRMVKEAKQAKGENSPEYTTALFALATFYHRLGDRPKAERLAGEVARFNDAHAMPEGFQQATTLLQTDSVPVSLIPHLSPSEIRRRTKKVRKEYGDAHPFYADALRNEILLAINDADSARLHQQVDEQCQVIRRIIQRNFPFMSGHQQTYLFLKYRDDLDRVYQIQHLMPDAEWAGHCYANALFTKGLLLRSSNRLRNALSHQDDTTTLGKYDRWLERQRKIAYLALRKGPIARMQRLIEEEKAEREEKELAARTLEWQEATSFEPLSWLDIQRCLSPREACVEFVTYPTEEERHYAALLLLPDAPRPLFIPLFGEKALTRLFPPDSLSAPLRIHALYTTDQLYSLIWEPLSAYLTDRDKVYLSPSGLLHQISFPALLSGRFPEELPYALHVVSSTREVVRFRNEAKFLPRKAALFGGIRYDADERSLRDAAREATAGERTGSTPWPPLRYSGYEIQQIQALLDSFHIPTKTFTGLTANEEAFRSLDQSDTQILHLSTHGYFLRDDSLQLAPMLRSGLVLAGANRAWLEKDIIEGIEDGLLTADEISLTRLGGLQLTVLSACDTGLGEINHSEGVFGLQRAFKLAGARSLIISLWSVDDRVTAEFMVTFYRSWLAGKEMRQAFDDTQRTFRVKYSNPYYWAGFVWVD